MAADSPVWYQRWAGQFTSRHESPLTSATSCPVPAGNHVTTKIHSISEISDDGKEVWVEAKVFQVFSGNAPSRKVQTYATATYTWAEFKTKATVPLDIVDMCEQRSRALHRSKGWYNPLLECLPYLQSEPQKKIICRWDNPRRM
ncbi:hypothetical protein K469DRAFT_705288 [Zopfia rhizophila CBS 207.26]|uniref:Uncharacterized protein n=1 Tax=Zopfia rhizophila CBS 207.26 TaxID=1314779 RepID=A0A6A6D5F9_9PEZI|nr:hypothetical protein K469DRAFT_705288 [Zopfia rhizophila CBS 207.26]